MSVLLRCPVVKTFAIILIGVLALTHVFGVKAEFCKWVDKDGIVHYAETCPEEVQGAAVEIQPQPSQSQIDAASSRYVDVQSQPSGQEESSSETDASLAVGTDQLRDHCVEARLSLDALSQKHPVYYDQTGKLRTELHRSVRFELDRSGKYLDTNRRAEQLNYWKKAERQNCTPEILGSGIRSEIKRKQREHLQRECVWWGSELEYMERNKSFHKERMDLKKLYNANCK